MKPLLVKRLYFFTKLSEFDVQYKHNIQFAQKLFKIYIKMLISCLKSSKLFSVGFLEIFPDPN